MNDKKTSVRTLTMLALLIAMSIVFSRVLSISTGFVRFNLGSLPVLLAAVVFGPGAGFAVGAVADIIGGVLAGYAINPLITLGAGAIGLVAGFAWQKLSSLSTNLRLAASVLLGHFVGSMVITSLALRLFYGYPSERPYWGGWWAKTYDILANEFDMYRLTLDDLNNALKKLMVNR